MSACLRHLWLLTLANCALASSVFAADGLAALKQVTYEFDDDTRVVFKLSIDRTHILSLDVSSRGYRMAVPPERCQELEAINLNSVAKTQWQPPHTRSQFWQTPRTSSRPYFYLDMLSARLTGLESGHTTMYRIFFEDGRFSRIELIHPDVRLWNSPP